MTGITHLCHTRINVPSMYPIYYGRLTFTDVTPTLASARLYLISQIFNSSRFVLPASLIEASSPHGGHFIRLVTPSALGTESERLTIFASPYTSWYSDLCYCHNHTLLFNTVVTYFLTTLLLYHKVLSLSRTFLNIFHLFLKNIYFVLNN